MQHEHQGAPEGYTVPVPLVTPSCCSSYNNKW